MDTHKDAMHSLTCHCKNKAVCPIICIEAAIICFRLFKTEPFVLYYNRLNNAWRIGRLLLRLKFVFFLYLVNFYRCLIPLPVETNWLPRK